MASSISGNSGKANATVFWTADDLSSNGSVISDGAGNYIITVPGDNTYHVNPALVGFAFSTMQSPVVSGGNVTGIDFTASAIPALTFTQLAAESFTEANVNPLNPAKWTTLVGQEALQVLNNVCEGTDGTLTEDNGELYTGVSFSSNQYIEFRVNALTGDGFSALAPQILTNADNSALESAFLVNNGDGTATLFINNGGVGVIFEAVLPFSIGDVFRIAAFGTQIIVYQNGTQVAAVVDDARPVSGAPCILLSPASALTDATVTDFAAGNVTTSGLVPYSVPDCRNYATFPNNAVDVNGTETYTVQQFESRKAGAPVDSRASVPVASGTYPQNSRTPGTFGPGE